MTDLIRSPRGSMVLSPITLLFVLSYLLNVDILSTPIPNSPEFLRSISLSLLISLIELRLKLWIEESSLLTVSYSTIVARVSSNDDICIVKLRKMICSMSG